MNLTKIIEIAIQNGGVTYNLNTGELNPETGFMVGVSKEFEQSVMWLGESELKLYIQQHATELVKQNRYLGIWFDGLYYVLDVAERFVQKRNAIFFGIIRGQDYIWDNLKEATVRIIVKGDPEEDDGEPLIDPESGIVPALHHIEHDKEVEQKLNKTS